jgi:hypothetical protein
LFQEWYCPKCTEAARTVDDSIPVHKCQYGNGLISPLIRSGTKAKIIVVEREDYVGKEKVQLDTARRPVMSVTTVRDEGQDCIVFPATATAAVAANQE